MSAEEEAAVSDRERLEQLAEQTRAPAWVCEVVRKLARHAADVEPPKQTLHEVPGLIYRH